jgi:hypothetical protein
MSDDNKNDDNESSLKPLLLHKPKTRRDFIAQGFISATAFALAPTALELLSSRAHAATTGCEVAAVLGKTPVIIIDLAGGGNIPGSNVMVGGAGGQEEFLSTYATLGLPPDMHPSKSGMTNSDMGLVFHGDSGMLRGIQSVASVQTRMNVEGGIFCTSSADDTSNNQQNPMYWLNKAGAKGQLTQLAGTNQSQSGGNSAAPAESVNPSVAPVKINSVKDAENLVGIGNRLSAYSSTKLNNILDATTKLSQNKVANINRRSLPDTIKALIGCSFLQTQEQVTKFSATAVSSDNDGVATSVFGMITDAGTRNRVAPITKMVVDGYVGAATIVLGGFDYHSDNRSDGEARDFNLGQVVGSIMEFAARKQKDVAIIVMTDGGLSANNKIDNTTGGRGKFGWGGDSGQRSSTVMMVYKKDGRPQLRKNNHRQVGWFKENGAVENAATITSNSVVNMSKALVANYLALHGEEGKLLDVVGDDPFRLQLDNYLIFDKIR